MLKNILNKFGLNNSLTYKKSTDNFYSETSRYFTTKLKFVNNRKLRKGNRTN
jgi:hypothetical protein